MEAIGPVLTRDELIALLRAPLPRFEVINQKVWGGRSSHLADSPLAQFRSRHCGPDESNYTNNKD